MPYVTPRAAWRVAGVQAREGHRLHVRFNDGTEGDVAMAGFVMSAAAGVFAALRDETVFAQARVVHGAVTWPGGLDLAPDAMYREIKQNGVWVLT